MQEKDEVTATDTTVETGEKKENTGGAHIQPDAGISGTYDAGGHFSPDKGDAGGQSEKPDREKEKRKKDKSADVRESAEYKRCESELRELNDKYMRMIAEYDNFRKRSAKEREQACEDVYAEVIGAILPIYDSLERAACFSDSDSLQTGIGMLRKNFDETLKKLGVTEIPAEGAFDPEKHNAVMHTEDDTKGESEIIEVLQRGFERGGRVIRYAAVKVAN